MAKDEKIEVHDAEPDGSGGYAWTMRFNMFTDPGDLKGLFWGVVATSVIMFFILALIDGLKLGLIVGGGTFVVFMPFGILAMMFLEWLHGWYRYKTYEVDDEGCCITNHKRKSKTSGGLTAFGALAQVVSGQGNAMNLLRLRAAENDVPETKVQFKFRRVTEVRPDRERGRIWFGLKGSAGEGIRVPEGDFDRILFFVNGRVAAQPRRKNCKNIKKE